MKTRQEELKEFISEMAPAILYVDKIQHGKDAITIHWIDDNTAQVPITIYNWETKKEAIQKITHAGFFAARMDERKRTRENIIELINNKI